MAMTTIEQLAYCIRAQGINDTILESAKPYDDVDITDMEQAQTTLKEVRSRLEAKAVSTHGGGSASTLEDFEKQLKGRQAHPKALREDSIQ